MVLELTSVPTTAGTGSETTGTAVLDIPSKSFKTAIAHRALKPTLGIVDTNNTRTCPKHVAISAGLDVLFHALESQSSLVVLVSGVDDIRLDGNPVHTARTSTDQPALPT